MWLSGAEGWFWFCVTQEELLGRGSVSSPFTEFHPPTAIVVNIPCDRIHTDTSIIELPINLDAIVPNAEGRHYKVIYVFPTVKR